MDEVPRAGRKLWILPSVCSFYLTATGLAAIQFVRGSGENGDTFYLSIFYCHVVIFLSSCP